MYLRPVKPKSRLENSWMEGLLLGVQDRFDEVAIGMRGGVVQARTVKRVRWRAEDQR